MERRRGREKREGKGRDRKAFVSVREGNGREERENWGV